MKRRNLSDSELDQLQKFKRENDKLKKQISSLRKQIARLDLDRYSNLKDLIEKHYTEDQHEEKEAILKTLKEKWKCFDCNEGVLEIIIYNKLDSTWYFRRCNNCNKRTKSQQYNSDVKGIINNEK